MFSTKAERFHYYNSLVGLAKALEGKYTTIDLRNESCLTGKIEAVDGFMNIEMSDVAYYNPRGAEYRFEFFFINARNIRYIHIPEGLSAVQLMENELASSGHRKREERKPTLRSRRTEKYQKEVLQMVADLKNEQAELKAGTS